MRVYSKEPGKEPDLERPFTLSRGATVGDLAVKIHKEIAEDLNSLAPPNGSFLTSVLTFTSPLDLALPFGPLEIRFQSLGFGGLDSQVNFDNVRLDATVIPEPSTGLLLGSALLGMAASRRRRRR